VGERWCAAGEQRVVRVYAHVASAQEIMKYNRPGGEGQPNAVGMEEMVGCVKVRAQGRQYASRREWSQPEQRQSYGWYI